MVYNFIRKKTLANSFSCKFSEIFEKTYFLGHIRADVLNDMNQKKLFLIYSHKNNSKDVLFSAVADMWAYSFSKIDSITDAFL